MIDLVVGSANWRPVLAAGAILLAVASAPAQSIHGRIVEERSGVPVSGAFVALLDVSGKQRDAALTDGAGRFAVTAPAPGRYTIGIERMGFVSTISDPIELAAGEVIDHRLSVPVEPIELAGILVTIDTACRVRPGGGDASRLWQEARKALSVTAFTQDRGLLRHAITTRERILDPASLRVREERSRSRTGVSRGSPYVSLSSELLAHVGFVRYEGDDLVYYGPDADILLSDEFLDGHCFEVRPPPPGEPGWIGLGFRPVQSRRLPDIAGTMWLDAATGELRLLEYEYTRLPAMLEGKGAGGRIEFERVESGEWYVSRWWIRMPVVRLRQPPPAAHPTIRAEPRPAGLAWIEEEGGEVNRIESVRAELGAPVARPWSEPIEIPAPVAAEAAPVVPTIPPDGEPRVLVPRAAGEATVRLGVIVRDAATGEPIEGVQVHLPGLGLGGTTGAAGRIDLPAVPPGDRALAFERLGYRSVEARVTLAAGEAAEVEARLDPVPVEVPGVTAEIAAPPNMAIGLVSHVITAEDIPRETPISVVQLIGRRVPGVRIGQQDAAGCPRIQTRNGPVDLVVLDGQPFADTCILHHLLPTDIRRVEMRLGLNSALDLGRSRGAAIVIETFHGGP